MSLDNLELPRFLSQFDFLPVVPEVALDQAAYPQGEEVSLGSKQVDVHHEKAASQEQDVVVYPYGLVLQNNKNTKIEHKLAMWRHPGKLQECLQLETRQKQFFILTNVMKLLVHDNSGGKYHVTKQCEWKIIESKANCEWSWMWSCDDFVDIKDLP